MKQSYAYINAKKVRRLRDFRQERWIASAKVPVSMDYPGRFSNYDSGYIAYAYVVAKTRDEAMEQCEAQVLEIHARNKAVVEEEKRKMREDHAHKSVRLD